MDGAPRAGVLPLDTENDHVIRAIDDWMGATHDVSDLLMVNRKGLGTVL